MVMLSKKSNKIEQESTIDTPVTHANSYSSNCDAGTIQCHYGEASAKKTENNGSGMGGLPSRLQSGMEQLSGFDMSDVRVHYNSAKPRAVGALAYAQGNQIHLGAGQEKHLPHEAWHVVQQKQGRVKPTKQYKKHSLNDDKGLEKEADIMGDRATSLGESTIDSTVSKLTSANVNSQPIIRKQGLPDHNVVQAKLGFELEMLVLVDYNGRPLPEKCHLGTYGDHLELTVDQNGEVEGPTPEAPENSNFQVPSKHNNGTQLGEYDLPPGWILKTWSIIDDAGRVQFRNADKAEVQNEYENRNQGGYLRRIDKGQKAISPEILIQDLDAEAFGDRTTRSYKLFDRNGLELQVFPADQRLNAEAALKARNSGGQIKPIYEHTVAGRRTEHASHPLIGMGMGSYASILEIVTKAYAPETMAGATAIFEAMHDAEAFAGNLETATGNLNNRVRLNTVAGVTVADDNIFVGNSHVGNQTTAASIQSTFAVDIAKLPAYFKAIQNAVLFDLKSHTDYSVTPETRETIGDTEVVTKGTPVWHSRALEEAAHASEVATAIINRVGKTTGSWKWKKDYTLENLRGVLTLMCQYLLMGKYFYKSMDDEKGGLDKNLAALLSRTNLSAIFTTLPNDERNFVRKKYKRLKTAIKAETERNGGSTIFTDPSQRRRYGHISTTVDQFIHKVFKSDSDGITNAFGGFHRMDAESIDPENRRIGNESGKTAPVFELRNMIPKGDGERFNKNTWQDMAVYQASLLRILNRISDADARKKISIRASETDGLQGAIGDNW